MKFLKNTDGLVLFIRAKYFGNMKEMILKPIIYIKCNYFPGKFPFPASAAGHGPDMDTDASPVGWGGAGRGGCGNREAKDRGRFLRFPFLWPQGRRAAARKGEAPSRETRGMRRGLSQAKPASAPRGGRSYSTMTG